MSVLSLDAKVVQGLQIVDRHLGWKSVQWRHKWRH
jgi:hypothetical protein